MRAFVAIEVASAVRDALDRLVAPVRLAHPEPVWTPSARWHLTLTFVAELPEHRLPDLGERLGRAASRSDPFEMSLQGVGHFGQRVGYVRVREDTGTLRRLAERTTAAARRCDLEVPTGRWRPHLTLVRARRPDDLSRVVPTLRSALDSASLPVWPVDQLVLVRSTLGPEPRHDPIERISLGSRE